MADIDALQSAVREAEEQLSRARRYFGLYDIPVDETVIPDLEVRAKAARAALGEALANQAPPTRTTALVTRHGGQVMGAATTGLIATVAMRMDRVATSLAHLYALRRTPLVTVRVENTSQARRRISVTCHIEGYSGHAIASTELDAAPLPGAVNTIDLFPPLFPERTRAIRELTAAALHVRVDDLDSGKPELMMASAIPLLPPTTAVLGFTDPKTGVLVDQRELLAAYITPNAPAVLQLLRASVDGTKLKAMIGYQAQTPDELRAQVGAIYAALAKAGIVYIDSRIAFGSGAGETIQRIRLPRESLEDRAANCIDGTVLMASLLEAAGIDPVIVIVPGHAYLGYRPTSGAPLAQCKYVETTVVSDQPFEKACSIAEERSASMGSSILRLDVRALRASGITPME